MQILNRTKPLWGTYFRIRLLDGYHDRRSPTLSFEQGDRDLSSQSSQFFITDYIRTNQSRGGERKYMVPLHYLRSPPHGHRRENPKLLRPCNVHLHFTFTTSSSQTLRLPNFNRILRLSNRVHRPNLQHKFHLLLMMDVGRHRVWTEPATLRSNETSMLCSSNIFCIGMDKEF